MALTKKEKTGIVLALAAAVGYDQLFGAKNLFGLLDLFKGKGATPTPMPSPSPAPAPAPEPEDEAPAVGGNGQDAEALPRVSPFAPGGVCSRTGQFFNGRLFPQGPEKYRTALGVYQQLGVGVPGQAFANENAALGWLVSADGRNKISQLQQRFRQKGYPAHAAGAQIDGIAGPCTNLDAEQALLDLEAGRWP